MEDCMLVKLTPGQQVTEVFSKNFGMNRFVPISDMENFNHEEVNCYENFIELLKRILTYFQRFIKDQFIN